MEIDKKLARLPLTKYKPSTLESLFGRTNILPMWVADMEFQVAKPIQEALIERISNSGFGYEYKPESFYSAQKEWYQSEYQIVLEKKDVLYSPTITTTIAVLIECFTELGDSIIIQPPVFMEFRSTINQTDRRIVKNPLKLDGNRYEFDLEDLEDKIKSSSSKILILCNTHNPVGRVWKREELQSIVEICKKYDVLIISDEIHKDIVLFGNRYTSPLEFSNLYERMVVCTSEAKSFNLCGIADSMAIIPNDDIKKSVSKIFKKYNLGRTNALTRVALETAYRAGRPWLQEVLEIIEKNVKSTEAELKESDIGFIKPEGTYQIWLDFRRVYGNTKEMFNQLTDKSGIGMNAGHWFGREGALFMRVNIATSTEKVVNSIKSIKNALPEKG